MIEKDIRDRVPTYAGRVRLKAVDGQHDMFDMERADEPAEAGTPLDKATLDSIIQSRLTGRFYELVGTRTTLTSVGGAYSPIPSSWFNTTATGATSVGYSIEASGTSGSYYPHNAFDGQSGTYWNSNTSKTAWLQLNVPEGINVTKMKISFDQKESWSVQTSLQGKTEDGAWVTLISSIPWNKTLTEYTLSNPNMYRSYRLNFDIYEASTISVYEWQLSYWNSATYRYDYKIDSGVPLNWTKGQRITVSVPNYTEVGVEQNTLNGKTINTILQPLKRYELVYNGSSFDAKEV